MKKLILSVFMFALIAGASVNSAASSPLAETPGIAASPNLAYCLWGSQAAMVGGVALGGLAGGGTIGWLTAAGYGLVASVGIGTGVGAVFIGAGI